MFASGNTLQRRFRHKEEFIEFLQSRLSFEDSSRNMVLREDVFTACERYFRERELVMPSTVAIGQYLIGCGVKVCRFGPMKKQKYCYVGLAWKEGEEEFQTLRPAKRGRKAKEETSRKRRRVETREEKVDDWSLVGGSLAPCAVVWNGEKVEIVRKKVDELKEELKKLVADKVQGWWSAKYDLQKEIEELLWKRQLKEEVEETEDGRRLCELLMEDESQEPLEEVAEKIVSNDKNATENQEEVEDVGWLHMPMIDGS